MKVVFLEQVEGTAYPGEVKDVANGFARNFLFPRGLAVPVSPASLQQAEALAKKDERRQDKLDEEARALLAKIEGQVLAFEERVGEQGRLFGSVTVSHVADRIGQLLGAEFDRHKVLMPDSLRQLGRYDVRLRLSRNVEATIAVEVVALGEEPSAVATQAVTEPAAAPKKRRAKEAPAAEAEAIVETEATDEAEIVAEVEQTAEEAGAEA